MSYLLFIIGCISNRFIRGGTVASKLENFLGKFFKSKAEYIRFVVSADLLNVIVFVFSLAILTDFTAFQVLLLGGFMWIGASPTWGEYLGAAINYNRLSAFSRNKAFDFIPNKVLEKTENPKAAGIVGLLLRGLFWGVCLAVGSLSMGPIFVGALMPLVYILSQKISEKLNYSGGWTIGEFIFGGLLWVSVL